MILPDRFENGQPMLLAGLRRRHSAATAAAGVAEQWRELLAAAPPAGRIGTTYFGVMCGGNESGFEYLSGVQVDSFDRLGPEIGRMRVPAQRYAVFNHPHGDALGTTWRRIFAWLASGPYESAHRPDFEVYPHAPDPVSAGGGVEVWVGVVERARGSAEHAQA